MDYVDLAFWIALGAALFLPFIAAWTDSELGAAQYGIRLFSALAAWSGIAVLAIYTHPLVIVAEFLPYFLIYRWSAMRLNAVGRSKWWLLVSVITLVGLAFAFRLCFMPDRPNRPRHAYAT